MPARSGVRKKTGDSAPSSSGVSKKKRGKKEDSTPLQDDFFKGKLLSKFRIQNVVRCFDSFQHGNIKSDVMRRVGEHIITDKLRNFHVYEIEQIQFDRRITALQFHPTNPHIIAIGSKGGILAIRSLEGKLKVKDAVVWEGIGPGGSITSISFNPFSPDSVFTSSIDGTVKVRSYFDSTCQTLLDTESFTSWYCCVNPSHETGLVVTGDTSGVLKVLNKDLKVVSEHRLHKKKLNSAEFCKSRSWLLATASLDSTVKLWDIRKLDAKSPLSVMEHKHPVNSAFFSQTNGNRLLTTDQHSELRIYAGPLFSLETLIPHPHRQFQHLTPIKATWHPLCDLVVAGRYPDPNWPTYASETRSVDVISAETGEMAAQLTSVSCDGIISLNVFNVTGEILASGMGMFVPYWRYSTPFESKYSDKDTPEEPEVLKPKPPQPTRPKRTPSSSDSKGNSSKKKKV